MEEKNTRVGAIASMNKDSVRLLGYGVYLGDEVPPEGTGLGRPNPKIKLDNGEIVWGFQCWWGKEDKIKEMIGDRKVIPVTTKELSNGTDQNGQRET